MYYLLLSKAKTLIRVRSLQTGLIKLQTIFLLPSVVNTYIGVARKTTSITVK